ncbi:MAG TPA: GNAT family protein [Thermoanaerobaculia bacterium]|nr:GNAT family protein [Thermoanaerobaculia bacterium]
MSRNPEVRLRPIQPGDASLLALWRSEPSVRRHQPLAPLTPAQLRAEISGRRHNDLRQGRGDRFDWIVEVGSRPAGWVTLVIHSWEHGLGECGYALSTPFQHRGIMPRALRQLLDELFARTDLYRVEARCAVDNLPSQRVLEGLGFAPEGRLRGYFLLAGKRVDNLLFAVTKDDWTQAG